MPLFLITSEAPLAPTTLKMLPLCAFFFAVRFVESSSASNTPKTSGFLCDPQRQRHDADTAAATWCYLHLLFVAAL